MMIKKKERKFLKCLPASSARDVEYIDCITTEG